MQSVYGVYADVQHTVPVRFCYLTKRISSQIAFKTQYPYYSVAVCNCEIVGKFIDILKSNLDSEE